MQGLDAGRFAQKYKFWEVEYTSRNNEFIGYMDNLSRQRKVLIEKYGIISNEVSIFMHDGLLEAHIKYGSGGRPKDSSKIIIDIIEGKEIICSNAVFSDGPVKICCVEDFLPKVGKMNRWGEILVDVSIDISKDIDVIVQDVKNFVLTMRDVASGKISDRSQFIERYRGISVQKFFADGNPPFFRRSKK